MNTCGCPDKLSLLAIIYLTLITGATKQCLVEVIMQSSHRSLEIMIIHQGECSIEHVTLSRLIQMTHKLIKILEHKTIITLI